MSGLRLRDVKDQALTWSCCFSALDTDPMCGLPARWHGFKIFRGRIQAMTSCCDEHKPEMEACVTWVHQMDTPCGLPGSKFRWPENECYFDEELDISGAGLIQAAVSV